MKTFTQVRDVLELSRSFHRQVSVLYHDLADGSERARARMLLDYLSRHETRLADCLARFEDQVPDHVMNAWFQYVPDEGPLGVLHDTQPTPGMSIDDVAALALRFDAALVGFYRELAECTELPEVRQVFASLVELEEHEEAGVVRESVFM